MQRRHAPLNQLWNRLIQGGIVRDEFVGVGRRLNFMRIRIGGYRGISQTLHLLRKALILQDDIADLPLS